MNTRLLDLFHPPSRHLDGRIFGAVIAVVTNNQDEDGLGRVKVTFPWLGKANEIWARLATLMAGNGRGTYFMPEVHDVVLVVFEQGDLQFPFVIGGLWSGGDKPPADNEDGENNVRLIKSRSGHTIRLNDKAGAESVEVVDAHGNSVVFDTASDTIKVTARGSIVFSAPQGKITLEAQAIEATSSGKVSVKADGAMEVAASGDLQLSGKRVDIN